MVVETRSSAGCGDGLTTDASPCSLAATKSRKRNRRAEAARGDGNSLPTDANPCAVAATNDRHDISNFISQSQSPTQPQQEEEEPMEKFLEALAKNTLVVLVKEAVSKYDDPDYIQSIRKVADVDPALRKIHVEVFGKALFDDETLTSVFGEYGEIEDYCFVDYDNCGSLWPVSAAANILFKHRYGARKVLRLPHINIGKDNAIVTSRLHSLVGDFSALSLSPGCCYRSCNQSSLDVEEPGEKLVDFFGKDYLVGLVMEAISKHPDFVGSVEKQASLDLTPRRVLVCCENLPDCVGILTSFYRKYGEIEECTGTEKMANILYKHRNSARKALKEPTPFIENGMHLDAFCQPGPEQIDAPLWKATGDGWSRIPHSEMVEMLDAAVRRGRPLGSN